ncbi:MAG: Bor/Iss family lipoprotein [Calditrichia bacterium]
MLKKLTNLLLVVSMVTLCGCYANVHTVGNGGNSANKVEKKQWYILWGLVPLNEVDSQVMAAGAENYTIKTEHKFVDMLIGVVTGIVTIQPKTVTVTKE